MPDQRSLLPSWRPPRKDWQGRAGRKNIVYPAVQTRCVSPADMGLPRAVPGVSMSGTGKDRRRVSARTMGPGHGATKLVRREVVVAGLLEKRMVDGRSTGHLPEPRNNAGVGVAADIVAQMMCAERAGRHGKLIETGRRMAKQWETLVHQEVYTLEARLNRKEELLKRMPRLASAYCACLAVLMSSYFPSDWVPEGL